MPPVNLATADITVPGTTKSSTFGARFSDIINVKRDFGATGDGSTDDTAAIQAALDYAFGTYVSPHGDTNKFLNRPVFFPNGNYRITGGGLVVRNVRSGYLFGAGKHITYLRNVSGSVFATNGFSDCRIDNLTFYSGGTGTSFNLDWDGTGTVGLGNNSFYDCGFLGASGERGIDIGVSGFGGAGNLFSNCDFANCITGLRTLNGSATGQVIIGGSSFGNVSGFQSATGSIQYVADLGVAVNTSDFAMGQTEPMVLSGIRSESTSFVSNVSGSLTLMGCQHLGNGLFISGTNNARVTMVGCSTNGTVAGQNNIVIIGSNINATFVMPSLTSSPVSQYSGLMRLRDVSDGIGFNERDNGTYLHNFSTAGAFTATFPANNTGLIASFLVATSNTMSIVGQANDVIWYNNATSTPGGSITTNTVGNSVTLVRVSYTAGGGAIQVVASNGTWTLT